MARVTVNLKFSPVLPLDQQAALDQIWQRLLQPLPKKNAPAVHSDQGEDKGDNHNVCPKQ